MAPAAEPDGGAYNGTGGMEVQGPTTIPLMDSGEKRLRELGYKQELNRTLSAFTNYGFGFSEIGVMMGVTGLYSYGFTYGGPVSLVWGWVVVAFFSQFLSLSLGEICSAYPTGGGVYFWAFQLGGRWGNVFSWVTAWFNLMAGFANVASVDMICANLIGEMVLLSTGTWYPSQGQMLGIFCFILVTHMAVNVAGIGVVGFLENISVFWDLGGTFIVTIVLLCVAPTHQSADFVFTKFIGDQAPGITSPPYIFLLGLLSAGFTLVGYDAAAHMSEESKGADKTTGMAMWLAVCVSSVTGLMYILALTFSIQGDPLSIIDLGNASGGYAGAQIYYDVFFARFGSGAGGIALLTFPMLAAWFSGMSCMTAASRVCFSFCRDKGLPGWQLLRKVAPYSGAPFFSILLVSASAIGFALLSLVSIQAFSAVTSIVVIGFYISYVIPITLRCTVGMKSFLNHMGPWNLGPFGVISGFIAVVWGVFLVVVLCLPSVYPITETTMNYAPVTVGGTVILAALLWVVTIWTRPGVFEGPAKTLEEVEHQLETDGKAHIAM